MTPEPSDDFEHVRELWRIPFAIALIVLLLAAMWLSAALNANGGAFTFGAVCLLGFAMLAAVVMGLAWWSRTAAWVHVRVEDSDGGGMKISIPFSARFIAGLMRIGRPWVDAETRRHMDMAAGLIAAWEQNPAGDPISIDVDDEGGRVQVFIG